MCESTDGWLVAWDMFGCVLVLSATLWLLPFTVLSLVFHTLTKAAASQATIPDHHA